MGQRDSVSVQGPATESPHDLEPCFGILSRVEQHSRQWNCLPGKELPCTNKHKQELWPLMFLPREQKEKFGGWFVCLFSFPKHVLIFDGKCFTNTEYDDTLPK